MTVFTLEQPHHAAIPRACRYSFGAPVLSGRQARSARRFAVANAILVLLAGWLTGRASGIYDQAYGWLAIGGYLAVTSTVQLLSVLPTVRRSAASIE